MVINRLEIPEGWKGLKGTAGDETIGNHDPLILLLREQFRGFIYFSSHSQMTYGYAF